MILHEVQCNIYMSIKVATMLMAGFEGLKLEYHANAKPLENSEKNSMCWSKVNVLNNEKIIIPYHASLFSNAIEFFMFLH